MAWLVKIKALMAVSVRLLVEPLYFYQDIGKDSNKKHTDRLEGA